MKYKEIMDKVNVDEEMRERVIDGVSKATDPAQEEAVKVSGAKRSLLVKRVLPLAAAACVLLLAGSFAARGVFNKENEAMATADMTPAEGTGGSREGVADRDAAEAALSEGTASNLFPANSIWDAISDMENADKTEEEASENAPQEAEAEIRTEETAASEAAADIGAEEAIGESAGEGDVLTSSVTASDAAADDQKMTEPAPEGVSGQSGSVTDTTSPSEIPAQPADADSAVGTDSEALAEAPAADSDSSTGSLGSTGAEKEDTADSTGTSGTGNEGTTGGGTGTTGGGTGTSGTGTEGTTGGGTGTSGTGNEGTTGGGTGTSGTGNEGTTGGGTGTSGTGNEGTTGGSTGTTGTGTGGTVTDESTSDASDGSDLGNIKGTEAESAEALSRMTGIVIRDLTGFPFEVSKVTYLSLDNRAAQIVYEGKNGEQAIYRITEGEAGLADYNKYKDKDRLVIHSGNREIVLIGENELYDYGYWHVGGLCFSVSLTTAVDQATWRLIKYN